MKSTPLHAFQWVTGPLYTDYPITYGFTLGVEYAAGGKDRVIEPGAWIRERQHRIRHTNIVKNVIEAESLRLTAVDFMVPDRPALVRRITIENTGAVPVENARVFVTFRVDPRNWRGAVVLNRKARTVTPKLPGNELGAEFTARVAERTGRTADAAGPRFRRRQRQGAAHGEGRRQPLRQMRRTDGGGPPLDLGRIAWGRGLDQGFAATQVRAAWPRAGRVRHAP